MYIITIFIVGCNLAERSAENNIIMFKYQTSIVPVLRKTYIRRYTYLYFYDTDEGLTMVNLYTFSGESISQMAKE